MSTAGLQITRRDLVAAMDQLGHARDVGKSASKLGQYVAKEVGRGAIAGLSAFGYGVLEGRYGPVKAFGLSADLLGALGIHGATFLGFFGDDGSGYAHSAAQGLLDGYLGRLGMGFGAGMRAKAGLPVAQITDPKSAFHIGAGGGAGVHGAGSHQYGNNPNWSYRFGAQQAGRRLPPMTAAEIASAAQMIK